MPEDNNINISIEDIELCRKILLKTKYDETTKRYILSADNYKNLNLTRNQLILLMTMSKRLNIKIESSDYRLPSEIDKQLFAQYNKLTKMIENNNSTEVILERRKIRDQIVESNYKLVRVIINRNLDKLKNIPNLPKIEDIYSLGYEFLFDYVEKCENLNPDNFTVYVSSHLMTYIKNELHKQTTGISLDDNNMLEKLLKLERENPNLSNEEKAKLLNITKDKVEELLGMKFILFQEHEIELNEIEDPDSKIKLSQNLIRELLKKIVNTLPEQKKEVIMLAYGLKDGKCYNDMEIAKIFNVSNSRIGIVRHKAIEQLGISLRTKYLEGLLFELTSYKPKKPNERVLKEIEEILIGLISTKDMLYYISEIPENEQKFLILYYGLEDGIRHNLKEIEQILNVRKSKISSLKDKAHKKLRLKIKELISIEKAKPITYREYLEYMMETYIKSETHNHKR